jgi:hypothetical protein
MHFPYIPPNLNVRYISVQLKLPCRPPGHRDRLLISTTPNRSQLISYMFSMDRATIFKTRPVVTVSGPKQYQTIGYADQRKMTEFVN